MAFNIHPKQITEHSNVNKRYRGLVNIPENPFLCWIFEASNSLFHIWWVLCSKILLKRPLKHLSLSLQLLQYLLSPQSLSLKTLRRTPLSPFFENLLFFFFVSPPPPDKTSSRFSDLPSQRSLPQPPFSTLLLLQPPFLFHSFCRHLFCPTPSAALKSEVDSLWPLRM